MKKLTKSRKGSVDKQRMIVEPLPGYKDVKPFVYAGFSFVGATLTSSFRNKIRKKLDFLGVVC
jgi:translation elongation factor EF-4